MPGARLSKDDYFLLMSRLAGLRGTCARRTVGCILVDEDYHVLATGYNGVPAGDVHCIDTPCIGASDPSGDTTRCRAIHAERNAVNRCREREQERLVRRAYVTVTPCLECAEYMLVYLPRLVEVHALGLYSEPAVRLLSQSKILVHVHADLRDVSLDLMLKLGERWR